MTIRNTLIDAVDRLGAAPTPDARWQTAAALFGNAGSDWITAGTAASGDQTGLSIRTSTPGTLMRDYMAERIYLDDPWMAHCAATTAISTTDLDATQTCGAIGTRQARLFRDHGIHRALLVPCYVGTRTGGIVLYARSRDTATRMADPAGEAHLRLLAALVAAHYRPEDDRSDSSQRYRTHPRLSPREAEVLEWLAQGLQSSAIAHRMCLAEVTVAKHLAKARAKLGARTREQALAIAVRDRLIEI